MQSAPEYYPVNGIFAKRGLMQAPWPPPLLISATAWVYVEKAIKQLIKANSVLVVEERAWVHCQVARQLPCSFNAD